MLKSVSRHFLVNLMSCKALWHGYIIRVFVLNESLAHLILPSGFPNVGKSSIINSIREAIVCNVGIQRGTTK